VIFEKAGVVGCCAVWLGNLFSKFGYESIHGLITLQMKY